MKEELKKYKDSYGGGRYSLLEMHLAIDEAFEIGTRTEHSGEQGALDAVEGCGKAIGRQQVEIDKLTKERDDLQQFHDTIAGILEKWHVNHGGDCNDIIECVEMIERENARLKAEATKWGADKQVYVRENERLKDQLAAIVMKKPRLTMSDFWKYLSQYHDSDITFSRFKEKIDEHYRDSELVPLNKEDVQWFLSEDEYLEEDANNGLYGDIATRLCKRFGTKNSGLQELDDREVMKITDEYMGQTGNSSLCAKKITSKFGTKKLSNVITVEMITSIVDSFDGNHIIYSDYDTEPYITDTGVKLIAQAIHNFIKEKELL